MITLLSLITMLIIVDREMVNRKKNVGVYMEKPIESELILKTFMILVKLFKSQGNHENERDHDDQENNDEKDDNENFVRLLGDKGGKVIFPSHENKRLRDI